MTSQTNISTTLTACRICRNQALDTIMELGDQPPANSLRSSLSEDLPEIPLTLTRCRECATVQLTETVNPGYLFKDYVWVTGTSDTARQHSRFFHDQIRKRTSGRELSVVEVASNDGTFLKPFKESGCRVLGVDPAANIAEIANRAGVPTIAEFFGMPVAVEIIARQGPADVVFARNVLPHVENVHDVVGGMAHCIGSDGLAVIEFHYSQKILDELHYDSIYHEHLFYYSLQSMAVLLEKHGLYMRDLEMSPISGGSVIVYCSKTLPGKKTEALEKMLACENHLEINSGDRWELFARQSGAHRARLKEMIAAEVARGSRIVGYGASARSSTLLNYCGIDNRHLVAIADQNPIKHAKYTPGTHIRILDPDTVFASKPDGVMLLAWNFKDELLGILKDRYHFTGNIIVPLPRDPEIIQL